MSYLDNPINSSDAHNKAIVKEWFDKLGLKIEKTPTPETEEQKLNFRLLLARKECTARVLKYYEDHPIATNLPELRKLIHHIFLDELVRWNKEDCIQLATMTLTIETLKAFGYE